MPLAWIEDRGAELLAHGSMWADVLQPYCWMFGIDIRDIWRRAKGGTDAP